MEHGHHLSSCDTYTAGRILLVLDHQAPRAIVTVSVVLQRETDQDEFITLVAGKRPSLLIAGNNDQVYDKKPQRYAEDNVM